MDFTITLAVARAEIAREIEMRHKVYPKWIADKRMNEEQANQRIAALRCALLILERVEIIGGQVAKNPHLPDLDMHLTSMASCKRVEGLNADLIRRQNQAPKMPHEEQADLF